MSDSTLQLDDSFDPKLRRAYEFAHEKVNPALVDYAKVKMHKDTIKVSGDGTFFTLQGEGPTMGLPCVFARLHVCNLRCTWCDAWYTWNPNTEEYWTESSDVSFEDLAASIRSRWPTGNSYEKRVIFSGGEPLIQRRQIDEVMRHLNNPIDGPLLAGGEWTAEFETNGTLMPTLEQLQYGQFNCSPKLDNSENHHFSMVKPKVLKALNEANTTFKFVCYDETDLLEIKEKYLDTDYISKDKVIIMPQGIRAEEIDINMKKLYEPCMKRGYRLLGRMQAQFADGARRGV